MTMLSAWVRKDVAIENARRTQRQLWEDGDRRRVGVEWSPWWQPYAFRVIVYRRDERVADCTVASIPNDDAIALGRLPGDRRIVYLCPARRPSNWTASGIEGATESTALDRQCSLWAVAA
jgi:hypothetical protein